MADGVRTSPVDVVTDLCHGRLRWDTLRDFPREDRADTERGDAAISDVLALLDACPDAGDPDGQESPSSCVESLRRDVSLRLQLDADHHGLGLSDHATFRVCSAVMERHMPAGFLIAAHNGIGLPALLPALPAGAQRDLVVRLLGAGVVSGWADTESGGAANDLPATIAEPAPDGGYRLTGEKVFISNGTVADELIVSAAVPGSAGAGLFLVNTRAAGFTVHSEQTVIGLKGSELGCLRLDHVAVPPERVLAGPGQHWRDTGHLEAASSRGRTYLVSGAALALARRATACQRDFALRRSVDGRPLGSLPAVQELLAASLADVYAIESIVRWCLPGGDDGIGARHRDRLLAKNITTLACWRIVDATMSLLAAEGAETAASKRARGAPPLPVERLLRDARVLRITGGVDFAVDLWAGERLFALDDTDPSDAQLSDTDLSDTVLSDTAPEPPDATGLSPRNARHLRAVDQRTRDFAQECRRLRTRHPHLPDLLDQQSRVIAAGRITRELLSMGAVLGRVASEDPGGPGQNLASVYCSAAAARIASAWSELAEDGNDLSARRQEHAELSTWWLTGGRTD